MYDIIYADPPWDYKGQNQFIGDKKTSEVLDHYPTLTLKDLKQLPISNKANPDSLLFMWSSSPHLDQAIDLMSAWGFDYKTIAFVWDKQKVNPGFYTLSQVEICLVGKKGKIPTPRGARNVRQFLSEERTRHSAKPLEIRTRIEQMFPHQSKLELFARTAPDGWDVFGNEVDSSISLN
tara:strand:+ start:17 stop:550 length:534 start_codon:yes stop_codon:yes gene_type:complete